MIIKKWNGSAWVAQSPKTNYVDIVEDVTAGTPVSVFSGGKLKESFLPDSVFGGMKFVGSFNISGSPSSPLQLAAFITGTVTSGYAISSNLDTFTGLSYSAGDYQGIGQRFIGYYWVATQNLSVMDNSTTDQALWTANVTFDDGTLPVLSGGLYADNLGLEAGDWVIITGWDNTNERFTFSVINNTYSTMTNDQLGVAKVFSNTTQTVAANAVTTTASRTYGIQKNSDSQLVVNVPWTDTNTTYTAGVGLVLSGTEFQANLIDTTLRSVTAETISTTANRTYAVMPDADGDLVVNVPWVDTNTTYGVATSTSLGLVELGSDTVQSVAANAVSATASRSYAVQLNSGNQMVVNVPWTDTIYTLPAATSTVRGGIELGSDTVQTTAANAVTTTASRSYSLQVNASGQGVVNVPWTDTTYSAGNGISLSSTQFSVAAGVGLTQEASGLKMSQPHIAGTATPSASYQVTDTLWFDTN